MNDGMIGVSCDVIIAYNEELPYIIDTKNCSEKAYISVTHIMGTGVTVRCRLAPKNTKWLGL